MARVKPDIPAASELLCETCGYRLTGLPTDGRCPECGAPVADSLPSHRAPSAWEHAARWACVGAFVLTTANILLRPGKFFRHLSIHGRRKAAGMFREIHHLIVALLLGWTLRIHENFTQGGMANPQLLSAIFVAGAVGSYIAMGLVGFIAALLTHWEASYRGLRLPLAVVRRALAYHAANYLPVALLGAITTTLFWIFREPAADRVGVYQLQILYLYTISGEVILAAGFLFWRYWIAMRNMMFANG
jgi:hypothetical protein